MKKKLFVFALVCCCIFSLQVGAKSMRDVTLYGGLGGVSFARDNTQGKCHSSALATYLNEASVNIKHVIQRYVGTSLSGTKEIGYTVVKSLNVGYDVNYNLGTGTANTRATFYNISNGTTFKGNVYLNNDWV